MSDEFEPIVQYTAADDWASDDAKRSMTHSQQAQDISDSVAIYLALGGKITEVPIGASSVYNPLVASVPYYSKQSTLTHPAMAKDLDMSKQVAHWISVNPDITFKELSEAMKLRSSTLARVINSHFAPTEKGQSLLQQYKDRGKTHEAIVEGARAGGIKGGATRRKNAALRTEQMRGKVRELLKVHPAISIDGICGKLEICEAFCRRLLREGFEGHAHVEWLMTDKRKRENREPA